MMMSREISSTRLLICISDPPNCPAPAGRAAAASPPGHNPTLPPPAPAAAPGHAPRARARRLLPPPRGALVALLGRYWKKTSSSGQIRAFGGREGVGASGGKGWWRRGTPVPGFSPGGLHGQADRQLEAGIWLQLAAGPAFWACDQSRARQGVVVTLTGSARLGSDGVFVRCGLTQQSCLVSVPWRWGWEEGWDLVQNATSLL